MQESGETGPSYKTESPGTVDVELDIFSGRENPKWALSDTETQRFVELLRMAPVSVPRTITNQLGYRGFIVHTAATDLVRVQNHVVEVSSKGQQSYLADPERTLERWLLNSGSHTLDKGVYFLVEEDLRH